MRCRKFRKEYLNSCSCVVIRLSGIDFDRGSATSVLAAAPGWVVTAEDVGSPLGNIVDIDHGDGRMTEYWHLSAIDAGIAVGSWVPQGTVVGTKGDHLHFESRFYRNADLPVYIGVGDYSNRDSSKAFPTLYTDLKLTDTPSVQKFVRPTASGRIITDG